MISGLSRSFLPLRLFGCRSDSGRLIALALLAGVLSGCSNMARPVTGETATGVSSAPLRPLPSSLPQGGTEAPIPLTGASTQVARPEASVQLGSGQFVNPAIGQAPSGEVTVNGPDVSLNFVNADVRDVMKSVVGGLLNRGWVVDPAVNGTVTLATPKPIPRSSVINVLTTALQMSGIGLVQRGNLYAAVPIANAARQAPLGSVSGFVSRVVPLHYVSAVSVEQALQSQVPPGATLKADPARNVLIISGSALDVTTLADDISSFDVDYLRGMSFALLPLQNGQAREVAADVNKMLASSSRALGDMVKVAPLERMNAILVTAMQPAYLREVESWVTRFDQKSGQAGQQLFIYHVQNGRASDLANVLRKALGIQGSDNQGGGGAQNAADSTGASGGFDISSSPDSGSATAGLKTIQGITSGSPPASSATTASAASAHGTGNGSNGGGGIASADALLAGGLGGVSGTPTSDVRVTADPTNNALIISATPQEYAPIRAALRQLDVTPLQVLIEATVAEVSLTNSLKMGLQYYINSGNFSAIFAPGFGNQSSTTSSPFSGFNLAGAANVLYASGGTNVVLQALQSLTTVHVLSSPDLLVLNNATAKLQVGNQVPIATQSATSNLTSTAQTVNSISYRDTGVILQITPRVNTSGLVQLDMSEEVSAPTTTAASTTYDPINSPTISTRRVTSTLAINDGQTVVLAGLIQQNASHGSSGLPWLSDIPVLGFLFGQKSNSLTRTELIVLITPYVIRNQLDADTVSNELRQKLRLTVPVAAQVN
jgi:general secretion pathway protein D